VLPTKQVQRTSLLTQRYLMHSRNPQSALECLCALKLIQLITQRRPRRQVSSWETKPPKLICLCRNYASTLPCLRALLLLHYITRLCVRLKRRSQRKETMCARWLTELSREIPALTEREREQPAQRAIVAWRQFLLLLACDRSCSQERNVSSLLNIIKALCVCLAGWLAGSPRSECKRANPAHPRTPFCFVYMTELNTIHTRAACSTGPGTRPST
jgi:hypothetical protein